MGQGRKTVSDKSQDDFVYFAHFQFVFPANFVYCAGMFWLLWKTRLKKKKKKKRSKKSIVDFLSYIQNTKLKDHI